MIDRPCRWCGEGAHTLASQLAHGVAWCQARELLTDSDHPLMLEAVLPFRCEECALQVSPSGGGMCFGCSRMLCAEHFSMRAPDRESAKRPEFECRRCQERAVERERES